jgi:hypothetical protein
MNKKLKHFPPEPDVIISYDDAQILKAQKEIIRKAALNQFPVEELEKQLAKAKEKKAQDDWKEYLNHCEIYFKSLIGKAFIRYHSSNSFSLFKVKGFVPQYYINRNGMNGSWHPSRWFQLTCSAMINCTVSDHRGRYYKPHIRYQDMRFNLIKKKDIKTESIDYIDFNENEYARVPDQISEFGKVSYETLTPDFQRELFDFQVYLRDAPPGMWEAAKELADQNIIATKKFWDIYQPIINKL